MAAGEGAGAAETGTTTTTTTTSQGSGGVLWLIIWLILLILVLMFISGFVSWLYIVIIPFSTCFPPLAVRSQTFSWQGCDIVFSWQGCDIVFSWAGLWHCVLMSRAVTLRSHEQGCDIVFSWAGLWHCVFFLQTSLFLALDMIDTCCLVYSFSNWLQLIFFPYMNYKKLA